MVIGCGGRHGASAERARSLMTYKCEYKGLSRVAGNAAGLLRASLRPPTKTTTTLADAASAPICRTRRTRCRSLPFIMKRAMTADRSGGSHRLWNPTLGIRFSPSPTSTPPPLYPPLDVARFAHAAAGAERSVDVLEGGTEDEKGRRDEGHRIHAGPSKLLAEEAVNVPAPADGSRGGTQTMSAANVAPSAVDAGERGKAQDRAVNPSSPPRTSLGFNMSDDLFHAARTAAGGSPESYWSHKLYRRGFEKVVVHYCTSRHTMELVCRKYFLGEPVLGFDLEWQSYATLAHGPRENVSLIQIASPSRIGLFHVALFGSSSSSSTTSRKASPEDRSVFVAPTFRAIMQDSDVTKVGVHIQGDCTHLRKHLGVCTRGVFELSHLYKQVKYSAARTPGLINRRIIALSTLVEECLRLPLYKAPSVRSSNWMRRLNDKQLQCTCVTLRQGCASAVSFLFNFSLSVCLCV
ncbi:hypothetical protein JDV02_005135 [Purpureocillium takamizusanense]|uniref:3'-5' exonuclease domain-containing protein n=1 Tax=Purpureocillium takamizusanense TaxID=2060973 RepID=A0A9Q8QFY3_9HYPO|nr:uncharacterized protein JDV02_005135 [Purpureocillium takamizusanense]UNI18898.1 hypothetical protein JDV02_005135 [Purpureocillium takamizusanense]